MNNQPTCNQYWRTGGRLAGRHECCQPTGHDGLHRCPCGTTPRGETMNECIERNNRLNESEGRPWKITAPWALRMLATVVVESEQRRKAQGLPPAQPERTVCEPT